MKILNFGSLNLDYVYPVDHFVRPGETMLAGSREVFCGGKGLNQSIAMARAGLKVHHAGRIGRDGDILLTALERNGVDTSLVAVGGGPSGHTIIQLDRSGQNCILLCPGENHAIDKAFVDSCLSRFAAGDIIAVQNEISEVPYVISRAHEKGMTVVFNPSPINDGIKACPLDLVDVFVLNEIEGKALTGCENPEESAEALSRRFPGCQVVLTVGKDGVFYRGQGKALRHSAYEVPVVDTTAAGDTFTGYFVSGLARGLGIEETLREASVASALAVSAKGAASSIPYLKDVLDAKLMPDKV